MISQIIIKDFAIIERLDISFHKGLTVLTGETGAGKSIIVNALKLILGERGNADLIRTEAAEASVEILFENLNLQKEPLGELKEKLENSGIELNEDPSLLVRRVISKTQKNRIFINNQLSTLANLSEITSNLMDIAAQHEYQSLLKRARHIDILDEFVPNMELRAQFESGLKELKEINSRLSLLRARKEQDLLQKETVLYNLKELTEIAPKAGEDQGLERDIKRLESSDKLKQDCLEIENILYSKGGAVLEGLSRVFAKIGGLASIDPSFEPILKEVESSKISIEEINFFVQKYSRSIETNPYQLETLLNRLNQINRLKWKYKVPLAEIIQKREEYQKLLESMDGLDLEIEDMARQKSAAVQTLLPLAQALHERRLSYSQSLSQLIEAELSGMKMDGLQFFVDISPLENSADTLAIEPYFLGSKGLDRVEFLISPNPGSELRPLSKIASGGELSRIMLAIKKIIMDNDQIPIYIFDEVDAGISGSVADRVGKKIKEISKKHQVICITHLPQIASYADQHLKVEKSVSDGQTTTTVRYLDPGERITEIAALLSGETLTAAAKKSAKELLDHAGLNE